MFPKGFSTCSVVHHNCPLYISLNSKKLLPIQLLIIMIYVPQRLFNIQCRSSHLSKKCEMSSHASSLTSTRRASCSFAHREFPLHFFFFLPPNSIQQGHAPWDKTWRWAACTKRCTLGLLLMGNREVIIPHDL